MKSVSALTPLESEKLLRAQAELREAALRFANKTTPDTVLYLAARQFDHVCREVGFGDYWLPAPPPTHEILPPPQPAEQ